MLEKLETEMNNENSYKLDELNTLEILKLINKEDSTVTDSVKKAINEINIVVKDCIKSLENSGRIIYAGAGTSGRLSVVDAVETVPTFGVKPGLFLPLMAGGKEAFFLALEAVEDKKESGSNDLLEKNVSKNDMVIGVAASGRTPYVAGVLETAKSIGCKTALICNVSNPEISQNADTVISLVTGPEVITGSTRMKAGSAQKMALNMISTTSLIKMGKTYKNYMVDVMILNKKLECRATKMISTITGLDIEESHKYLLLADKKTKLAILMILSGKTKEECLRALSKTEILNKALKYLKG